VTRIIKSRPSSANRRPPPRNRNLLLAALPAGEYSRIARSLETVPLKLKSLVHRAGDPVEHVYFPRGGFFSMVTVLMEDRMVEVATIGREGMVGIEAVQAYPVSSAAMVQGEADSCYRMKADVFRREMDRRGVFYEVLTHYAQALVGFIVQSTACNAVHSVEQRVSALAVDGARSDGERPLSADTGICRHDARGEPADGDHRREHVAEGWAHHLSPRTIVDGKGLEAASCECYRTTTDLMNGVMTRARRRNAPKRGRRRFSARA